MASIFDLANGYAQSGISRFHMPGHKGTPILGCEPIDLTEIKGADFLFEPDGIIAESERRTADAFGAFRTCYSAEGSSLSIKAALCMVRRFKGRDIRVASARNCHGAFISACTLVGVEPVWLYPDGGRGSICGGGVTADRVRAALETERLDAVYITSPDYLGGMADIKGIAEVCREHEALLIVDNAHGAYLNFLEKPLHPLRFGADIVVDSAHKTLPVLTGGAYLHISHGAPRELAELAKPSMMLFGSTSPSYLIMQSLDICADLLHDELPEGIRHCCERTAEVKQKLGERGIGELAEEPMKITIDAAGIGYDGGDLAELLRAEHIECEYADIGAVVLMPSPYNSERDFQRLLRFIDALELRPLIDLSGDVALFAHRPERRMSIREAMLAPSKRVPVDRAEGMICARPAMSCQPSVAIAMPGEVISREMISLLKRYGFKECETTEIVNS